MHLHLVASTLKSYFSSRVAPLVLWGCFLLCDRHHRRCRRRQVSHSSDVIVGGNQVSIKGATALSLALAYWEATRQTEKGNKRAASETRTTRTRKGDDTQTEREEDKKRQHKN